MGHILWEDICSTIYGLKKNELPTFYGLKCAVQYVTFSLFLCRAVVNRVSGYIESPMINFPPHRIILESVGVCPPFLSTDFVLHVD